MAKDVPFVSPSFEAYQKGHIGHEVISSQLISGVEDGLAQAADVAANSDYDTKQAILRLAAKFPIAEAVVTSPNIVYISVDYGEGYGRN